MTTSTMLYKTLEKRAGKLRRKLMEDVPSKGTRKQLEVAKPWDLHQPDVFWIKKNEAKLH